MTSIKKLSSLKVVLCWRIIITDGIAIEDPGV